MSTNNTEEYDNYIKNMMEKIQVYNFDEFKILMNKRLDIKLVDKQLLYSCALLESTNFDDIELVKYFVEKGANIHILDDMPLINAVTLDNTEIIKYLIEKGADIHINNDVILKKLIENCNKTMVEMLLEQGNYNLREFFKNNDISIPDELYPIVQKHLDKLVKKHSREKFKNLTECPITRCPFEGEIMGCSKCLNIFDREALEKWIREKQNCPICKNTKFYYVE